MFEPTVLIEPLAHLAQVALSLTTGALLLACLIATLAHIITYE
jgi:hypothetical protein